MATASLERATLLAEAVDKAMEMWGEAAGQTIESREWQQESSGSKGVE